MILPISLKKKIFIFALKYRQEQIFYCRKNTSKTLQELAVKMHGWAQKADHKKSWMLWIKGTTVKQIYESTRLLKNMAFIHPSLFSSVTWVKRKKILKRRSA